MTANEWGDNKNITELNGEDQLILWGHNQNPDPHSSPPPPAIDYNQSLWATPTRDDRSVSHLFSVSPFLIPLLSHHLI